jgi:hypothetical protein
MADVRIDRLWQSSLMEAISRRRSFRFGQGFEMTFGPWAGYRSKESPVPLTELETAILCAVASGTTGVISGDNIPLPTYPTYAGRTVPAPCNMWSYALFFVNEQGVFYYPPPEPTKQWEFESREDRDKILQWFRQNTVKVADKFDVPLSYPALQSSNRWDAFRPGSTVFMIVAENISELINGILLFSTYEDRFKVIDDRTGKPAGCEKWIKSGWLTGPEAPLSTIEIMLCIGNGAVAGAMAQNMLLAMSAMGLGGYPFDGFTPIFVLGGTPLARGLGFRFTADKHGVPNPVGKDGVFEALCPPYKRMDEAVDYVFEQKYGPEGSLSEEKRKIGPYKNFSEIRSKLETIPKEAIECTKAIVNYCYDTYGRFPVNYDTVMIPMAVQAHHPDFEFYDKHMSLPLPSAMHDHMKVWHEEQ